MSHLISVEVFALAGSVDQARLAPFPCPDVAGKLAEEAQEARQRGDQQTDRPALAAVTIDISDCHARPWRERCDENGFTGPLDQPRCRPSENTFFGNLQQVLGSHRKRYFGFVAFRQRGDYRRKVS